MQTLNGLPPHKLSLSVGTPVMLLRNLNPKMGLSNGTRLTVKALFDSAIDCEVSTGKSRGQRIYLPRFVITANAQPGSIAPLATTNCPLLCYVDNFLYECAMQ